MSLHTSARLFVITALTGALIACSSQSPVSPGGVTAPGSLDGKPSSGGGAGVYELTFWAPFTGGYQEVSSLQAGSSKILYLKARVMSTSGAVATAGTVTFDYCSYGPPTDDFANPDEAPKEACEQGAAEWVPLDRAIRIADKRCLHLAGASACLGFGYPKIPRSIGFRFRFTRQGSSIASGISPARNFVWVAP